MWHPRDDLQRGSSPTAPSGRRGMSPLGLTRSKVTFRAYGVVARAWRPITQLSVPKINGPLLHGI